MAFTSMALSRTSRPAYHLLCSAMLLLAVAGCKQKVAAPSDADLTSSLNRELSQDASISGQPITGSVQGGVATLTGNVSNDAQKVIAARDAAGIAGVSMVHNDLAVLPPASVSSTTIASPPATVRVPTASAPTPRLAPARPVPAPIDRLPPPGYSAPENNAPGNRALNEVPHPAPPPPPAFREVTLPAGSALPVRMTQTLDSATTQTGDSFSGVLASDVLSDGLVVLPAGTAVSGHVDAVQEAAHFKGNSLLTVSLSSVRARGGTQSITSDPYSVTGKGRGKNTAEKAGGGAAVGAILGGIFGGGKGAAIGAAAGGGTGAGVNAVTRGQQVQIASESVVRFQTSSPLTLRVRTDGGRQNEGNGLQPRPNQ